MVRAAALITSICVSALASPALAMRYSAEAASPVPFQTPALGEESEAEVGQSLASAGMVMPAVEVTQGARAKAISGDTIEVPTGVYRLVARSESGAYYRPQDTTISLYSFWTRSPFDDGGIHIPDDPGAIPKAYFRPHGDGVVDKVAPELRFHPISPVGLPGGFRRELIYGGASKGTISLSYREFVDDMARPAFTQDLSYDLAEGSEIGFRGARIRVLSATNTSIRYVVEKPLAPDR